LKEIDKKKRKRRRER